MKADLLMGLAMAAGYVLAVGIMWDVVGMYGAVGLGWVPVALAVSVWDRLSL